MRINANAVIATRFKVIVVDHQTVTKQLKDKQNMRSDNYSNKM